MHRKLRGWSYTILLVLGTNACAFSEDYRLQRFVEKQCTEKNLIGSSSGVEANIKAQRDELKSVEFKLSAEEYTKLSHKLDEFERSTELIREGNLPVCREWAMCQYRFGASSPTACDAKLAEWRKEHDTLKNYLASAQSLKIMGPKGTTYNIVFDKPISLQEAIESLKRLVTDVNLVLAPELEPDGSVKTRKFSTNLKDVTLDEILNAFIASAQDTIPLSWNRDGKNILVTAKK